MHMARTRGYCYNMSPIPNGYSQDSLLHTYDSFSDIDPIHYGWLYLLPRLLKVKLSYLKARTQNTGCEFAVIAVANISP